MAADGGMDVATFVLFYVMQLQEVFTNYYRAILYSK